MRNASVGSEEEYYKRGREEKRSMENNTNIIERTSMFGDSSFKQSFMDNQLCHVMCATYARLN